MTDREQETAGLLLCMMALSGGLNGGGNMGQNMSFAGMQNAVQANESALRALQMQQNSRMTNCQTVNPLCREMEQNKTCGTCKSWDIGSTTLCAKFRTSKLAYECSFFGHPYWEPKEPEQEPVRAMEQQAASCESCKRYMSNGMCRVTDEWSIPTSQWWTCQRYEPRQMETQAMQEDIDLMRQQLKYKIEELQNRVEVCKVPRFTPVRDEAFAAICGKPYKPPEPRLTLDDLYNLAFPVDPIRDHFSAVYDRINKDIEAIDRVEVVPVERVQVLSEQDGQSEQNGRALGGVVELCAAFVVWLVVASFTDTLNAVGFVSFLVSFALVRFVIKKFFSQRGD